MTDVSNLVEELEEQIQGLMDEGERVKEKIEEYKAAAEAADARYKAKHSHRNYIPLDDLPYGEENIRLNGVPEAVEDELAKLKALNMNTHSVAVVAKVIEEAREKIENAESEVDDCTPIETSEDEEEDAPFP
jgi:predicted RNase H-like nuclease (RuvC/YqgF family)